MTTMYNYLYDVFETTAAVDAPDLHIGLAHHMSERTLPQGVTEDMLDGFVAKHYEALVIAYRHKDRAHFVDICTACAAEEAEDAEEAAHD